MKRFVALFVASCLAVAVFASRSVAGTILEGYVVTATGCTLTAQDDTGTFLTRSDVHQLVAQNGWILAYSSPDVEVLVLPRAAGDGGDLLVGVWYVGDTAVYASLVNSRVLGYGSGW